MWLKPKTLNIILLEEIEMSGDQTNPPKKGFIQNLIDTIREQVRDISYVEIVTAVGDVEADVNPDAELIIKGVKEANLKIKARTRIELDGDIMVIVPGSEVNGQTIIDKEIMTIHKENVDVAVKNWNIFMENMFNTLKVVMEITGIAKADVLNDFQKPVTSDTNPKVTSDTNPKVISDTNPPA